MTHLLLSLILLICAIYFFVKVSAPTLQECTSSHAVGIVGTMGIGDSEGLYPYDRSVMATGGSEGDMSGSGRGSVREGGGGRGSGGGGEYAWPTTPEEYAVFALRLQREQNMRDIFKRQTHQKTGDESHGDQLVHFCRRLKNN